MKKIKGIKSVDIKIEAEGFGVVNFNGSASIFSRQAGKYVSNHMLPKMRGVDMMRVKNFEDIDEKAKLYISQNCIKNALFGGFTYNLKNVSLSNVDEVLSSIVGLVRGFVIAEGSTSLKRKSPLLIEDFVASKETTLNYEQFSQAGARNETSIFSKHTTGEVKYDAYASINIEDLQFLPLEDTFNRSCYREIISEEQGQELANKITEFLKSLDFDEKYSPEAVFSNNYVRINAISKEGEAGILLNEDAITLLVEEIVSLIKDLYISRSRAYVKVKNIFVDYNSEKTMRIKDGIEYIDEEKDEDYAIYYEAMPFSAEEYREKVKEQEREKSEKAKKSKKETKKKEEKTEKEE